VSVKRIAPATPVVSDLTVATHFGLLGIGPMMLAIGAGVPGGGAWPAANRALLIPFVLPRTATAYKIHVGNGGTVSGNLDAGIYSAAGALLVSIGSTANAGTNVYQSLDIADTQLTGGTLYYVALVFDNATATPLRSQTNARVLAGLGVREKATSFPLPDPLTGTAVPTSNYVPGLFVELRSL